MILKQLDKAAYELCLLDWHPQAYHNPIMLKQVLVRQVKKIVKNNKMLKKHFNRIYSNISNRENFQ